MDKKKPLTLDEFLSTEQNIIEYAEVLLPSGVLRIGSITADEYVEWEEVRALGGQDAKKNASALLIMRSLVDETGKRIGDATKAAAIRGMRLKTTETLLKAIFKLNGLNQKDETIAKNA